MAKHGQISYGDCFDIIGYHGNGMICLRQPKFSIKVLNTQKNDQ